MQAPNDQNSVCVAMGWDGTQTRPLLVDPTTGRLLVTLVMASTYSPVVHNGQARRDANGVTVAMGVNSADRVTPLSLSIDNVNGYLSVDIA